MAVVIGLGLMPTTIMAAPATPDDELPTIPDETPCYVIEYYINGDGNIVTIMYNKTNGEVVIYRISDADNNVLWIYRAENAPNYNPPFPIF